MNGGPRMAFGKVKWFNDTKGFGFIIKNGSAGQSAGKSDEIFVHYSAISADASRDSRKTLKEGDAVEFDVYEGEKGLQAQNVVVRT